MFCALSVKHYLQTDQVQWQQGTTTGITALQMDLKTQNINFEVLEQALEQARQGRLHILQRMDKAIDTPRTEYAETAPRVTQFKINPSKIREVIGRGGSTIREIIEKYHDSKNVAKLYKKEILKLFNQ